MADLSSEQKDDLISQFCSFTGPDVGPQQASGFLSAADWNVEEAVQTYFAANEGNDNGDGVTPQATQDDSTYTGPRTLDGRPAPESISAATSSQPNKPSSSSKRGNTTRGVGGLRTLKDLQGDSGQGHDDDDDDDDAEQDLFAGGEKSGLAVQNPGQSSDPQAAIQRMLEQAKKQKSRSAGEEPPQQRSRFTGTGQTLGGEETESRVVTQPTPQEPEPETIERRDLHIWRNGFSVDDGPLFRYDDPANAAYLDMINRGQAPVQLMNARHGQSLDVHLNMHREDDYVKPKTQYKPFGGSGQRLGSPTPGASSSTSIVPPPAAAAVAPSAALPSGSSSTVKIDDTQPTIALQIRLGDGTRLRARFNTTHTIADVYSFVNSASPDSALRAWALMTTFPSKELSDKSVALGDIDDLKRGGTVVQKWT